jgi:hypothetical protein
LQQLLAKSARRAWRDVRFAPKATELLRGIEMTRRAICDLLHGGKLPPKIIRALDRFGTEQI